MWLALPVEAASNDSGWFTNAVKDHPRLSAVAGLVVLLSIYPLVLLGRRFGERSRFRKEYMAEKTQLDLARKQADEEYRATGGGPPRTYAAQGRRLPQVDKPSEE